MIQRTVTIQLTESEIDYIFLLTALDAMRIHVIENRPQQDGSFRIRHELRVKLLEGSREIQRPEVSR